MTMSRQDETKAAGVNELTDGRYQLLFEEVPCYISIQGRDHRVLEANRLTREVFGGARGDLCYHFFKQRDDECVECPVREAFLDGQMHRSEEVLVSRTGESMHVLVHAAPLLDEEGRVFQVMEMATDITSIRQLQSQLESIGLLISSVSHGIKGMLTGLDGGKYLVNSGLEKNDPKRVKQGWEMVQRNVDQIRNMVLNILYYAKERELDLETFELQEICEEVCRLVSGRAQEHGVIVRCEVDPSAGSVSVDRRAVRSALVNLLENAIDACRIDKKKELHQVELSARGDPDRIQLVVEDNGIGMDAETRGRAFSLFFSSKGAEGTGLGLFIANKIATAHGGTIRIESTPDQGTRIIINLPRKPAGVSPASGSKGESP